MKRSSDFPIGYYPLYKKTTTKNSYLRVKQKKNKSKNKNKKIKK